MILSDRLLYLIDQSLEHFDFEMAFRVCEALELTYGDLPPVSEKYIPTEDQLRESVKDNLIDLISSILSEKKVYGDLTGGYFRLRYYIDEDDHDIIIIDFQPLSLEMQFTNEGKVSAITGDINSDWQTED